MTDEEKRLAKFCYYFEMDCNYCPHREACDDFRGKYGMLPIRAYLRAYQKRRETNERD